MLSANVVASCVDGAVPNDGIDVKSGIVFSVVDPILYFTFTPLEI
jgi:hypothetical protein